MAWQVEVMALFGALSAGCQPQVLKGSAFCTCHVSVFKVVGKARWWQARRSFPQAPCHSWPPAVLSCEALCGSVRLTPVSKASG